MNIGRRWTPAAVVALLLAGPPSAMGAAPDPSVLPNDNTRPAGRTTGNTVAIRLRAAVGRWQPEGPQGAALAVEAFGEDGAALMVPAPLIRVQEGASVNVSIRNELDAALRVHGLCARDGGECAPLDVAPRTTRAVTFASGRAGTYHYWATTMAAPVPFRELAGAFVVDPPGRRDHRDRIFVVTEWNSLTAGQLHDVLAADDISERFYALGPRVLFVINGRSWPATERLTYRQDDDVRWRVINLSSQPHPMHLHGFYFSVLRTGDGRRDEPVNGTEGRRVVTHLLPSGGTMALQWRPEREGNWLFHCHIMSHVSPARRLDADLALGDAQASHDPGHSHTRHDASVGMAGMVLGITVLPRADAFGRREVATAAPPPTQVRMVIAANAHAGSGEPAIGIALDAADAGSADSEASSPGPPLVLRRGEPAEITVVNRLGEPTAVHWHGLEIESYYDGVHGWSGTGRRLAPMIAPGESFVVRLTPARAGTFIYHTHLHDYRQLSSGLYGPLIVLEPGDAYDPTIDHVVVLGRRSASEASGVLQDPDSVEINGARTPRWVWRAGTRHRVRLINITPDDVLTVSLVKGDGAVQWRPLTKDGAPVPAAEGGPVQARVRIAVGETYDFEYETPAGRGVLWLEVRTTSGKWQVQGQVVVR